MKPKANNHFIEKKTISLELAKKIAKTAKAVAVKNNWKIIISIVDDGGNLIYFERMDDTQIAGIDISIQKARSAIRFKRPTKIFADALAAGNISSLSLPGAFPHEGGLPLIFKGKYIGAIGITGVTSTEDGMIAKAGADVLSSLI